MSFGFQVAEVASEIQMKWCVIHQNDPLEGNIINDYFGIVLFLVLFLYTVINFPVTIEI